MAELPIPETEDDEAEEVTAAEKKKKREDDEKVLELARSRFKTASDAEQENREKELDDIRFAAASPDDNYQWPKDVLDSRQNKTQEGGPRPCLTINPLPTHINQVTNEQRMNQQQIKVRPATEKAAKETAKVYDGLLRHIQVRSEASLAINTATQWQVAAGEGFFRLLTEYCDETSFDQDIVIRRIGDRFKVYMDPVGLANHPAGRMCQWGFIIEDMPKLEYEDQYTEHPIDWTPSGIGDKADWFPNRETVRIAEYFALEKTAKTLCRYQVGDKVFDVLKDEPLPPEVPAGSRAIKERQTKIVKCIWRKINGQHVLDEREMPTKYIPIVRVIGNEWVVEGKPIISGITRNAKDSVRMYNYNASMEAELNALAPRAPFVAMAQQIKGHEDKWRSANRVNYSVLLYNAVVDPETNQIVDVAPPQRAQPGMPQAAVIAAKMAAADDIKKTTGQYDPSLGNNPQAKSGIALQREQVKSEVGTYHYIDNLNMALRYAGEIILDMAPKVYTGRRILRILGEDGEPDYVQLNPEINAAYQAGPEGDKKADAYRLDVGGYDLVVTTGPSFTTKRQEAAEFFSNAVQAAKDPQMAAVLTYLALKSNDWAGADEATAMVKKMLPPNVIDSDNGQAPVPPQVQQAMDQLKHQLGQAMGQLDAAKQALIERDATLKETEGELKSKRIESIARMYEADKKAMAEIEKARAEVVVARAEAVNAAAQQPGNPDMQAVVAALTQVITEMDTKIAALAASCEAMNAQMQQFEIAARMPAPMPAAPSAPPAAPGGGPAAAPMGPSA